MMPYSNILIVFFCNAKRFCNKKSKFSQDKEINLKVCFGAKKGPVVRPILGILTFHSNCELLIPKDNVWEGGFFLF